MPRLVDHDARREALLDRAFDLFAARGFAAVTMRDLARSIDASTGTLYHYFDGKEQLFEALVRRRAAADVREATRDLGADATAAERLAAFGRFVQREVDGLQDTLRVVMDFQQQRPEPAARAFVEVVLDAYRAPLRGVFGEVLGGVALSLFLGLLVQRTLDPDHVDVATHLRALGALLPADARP